ncbi:ATP-binding protein [Streptomyces sp. NRRL S-87]|uniref:ATP-binding protein n=1 Tax=Streptomyces sp. NRRL S-87 TaxID=1463920 RepID=UPI00055AFFBD|nr:ATP-binding protein [Streptomyces sp. NRRL S-87]
MARPVRRGCDCGSAGAAARARAEVRGFVDEALATGHGLPADAQDAVLLVVSELVTNAVRHTPGPCNLEMAWAGDGIDIDVTDTSPEPPRLRPQDPAGSGDGYGWRLVNRLASDVDVRPTREGGKTVHVHVPGT